MSYNASTQESPGLGSGHGPVSMSVRVAWDRRLFKGECHVLTWQKGEKDGSVLLLLSSHIITTHLLISPELSWLSPQMPYFLMLIQQKSRFELKTFKGHLDHSIFLCSLFKNKGGQSGKLVIFLLNSQCRKIIWKNILLQYSYSGTIKGCQSVINEYFYSLLH